MAQPSIGQTVSPRTWSLVSSNPEDEMNAPVPYPAAILIRTTAAAAVWILDGALLMSWNDGRPPPPEPPPEQPSATVMAITGVKRFMSQRYASQLPEQNGRRELAAR